MAGNQVKAGAVLSYAVLFLNTGVGLLYTPYMLRMLGQSEYGLYSLVASVVAYLTILDLGFGNAIVRYTAKFRAEGRQQEQYSMFGMFTVLYSLIGVVALAIGLGIYFNIEWLFSSTMTAPEIATARVMMLLLTFNLAITFPFSLFGSIISAYEYFIFQKIVQIVRIVLSTITMMVLLSVGYRAIGLVVVTTIFNVLTLLLNFWYCKSRIGIKVRITKFDFGFLKEVSVYSFYILLNSIMDRVYWSTGQFILGTLFGTTAVAIYSVAITLQQMYMQFSTAISGVLLPRVTAMVANNCSNREISDIFIRTGRMQYLVMSLLLSGFVLFGQAFINIWAGVDYSQAYIITLLFFVPLTVPLIQNLGITILQARNQMQFRSVVYVIIALLSLGLSIVLAKEYGVVGCAVGTSTALVLGQILVMNIYYHKRQHLDIPRFWSEIAKMSIVPVVLGVIGYVALKWIDIDSIWTFVASISVFVAIYIPLCWQFSMNSFERETVLSGVRKVLRR